MEAADDAYWDEIAGQGDALPDGWRRHARDAHLALLERWVGAPTGRWLKTDLFEERDRTRALLPRLASATWVGADLAPLTVRGAGVARGVAADVRRLPFPDGAFDGVLSTSTLDHFEQARSIELALAELRRVLAPGGRLVLTLDNPDNPLIRLRNALPDGIARRTGLVPFAVGATLDVDDGCAALRRHGFEVLDTALLLHAPHVVGTRLARFAAWERHALPRLDRLGTTRVARRTGHFVAFLARASGTT
ncbi:MAG TPA: methyltransferase domain-containing protein [Acidimicrobiales bacterium]|nr:methyltransferase domain-containing protein [Acidimicrobiales bacterium]